ncbi:MAG: DUF4917 family protein [Bacilli bacterium]
MVVLKYEDVLGEISNQENHLLLGNGFNLGLGIGTSYPEIFKEMIESRYSLYENALPIVEECNYDLEKFIGKLTRSVSNNEFLEKFIANKIKLDFMCATQNIVKKATKKVYSKHNEGVFILLKNFTNYFTLNFDSCLYLLLLNFQKTSVNEKSIAITPTIKFIGEDLNEKEDDIYTEIKMLRENGAIEIHSRNNDIDELTIESHLSNVPKTHFMQEVKLYAKKNNKRWSDKEIKKVIDMILQEEKDNCVLENLDDGFVQISLFDEFIFDKNNEFQNLYFLHGAFHIYEDKNNIKKITQQTHKALYDRLEEILNDENLDVVTVFKATNKIQNIEKNEYLLHCLNKLKNLKGNLVIIGSSLDENDSHIFSSINASSIDKIYVSAFKNFEETFAKAKEIFTNKEVILFDAESISYKIG